MERLSCRNRHLPYSDGVVAVTSEKSLSVRGPSQRQTLEGHSLGRQRDDVWSEFVDHFLAFQILEIEITFSCKI